MLKCSAVGNCFCFLGNHGKFVGRQCIHCLFLNHHTSKSFYFLFYFSSEPLEADIILMSHEALRGRQNDIGLIVSLIKFYHHLYYHNYIVKPSKNSMKLVIS